MTPSKDKVMMKFGMDAAADENKKPSLFEQIKLRRRSTNPICWSCRTYPNCGLCEHRKDLRHQRVNLNQDQIQTLRLCIRYADENGNFTPTRAGIELKHLEFLKNRNMVITLKDNRANPYLSVYHVDANHPDVKMYWNIMRKKVRE